MPLFGPATQRRAALASQATCRVACVLPLLLTAASILNSRVSLAAQDGGIRVSRYTTVSSGPPKSQIDPLEAVVQVNFPRTQVHSVGEATAYLLLRTGYHLAPADQLDAQVRNILALPLPEVHRKVGPYTVSTALSVLLGQPFALSVDAGRREVTFHVEGSAKIDKPRSATPLVSNPADGAFPITK